MLDPSNLGLGLLWYPVFLLSTTLHEAAHAWVAYRGGDQTAYQHGSLTLNPIPHIRREPFGMVVVPVLSFVMSGWMLGWASVPYDRIWADRYPRRAAWMSLAGPGANLVLTIVAGLLIRAGMLAGVFYAPDSITFDTVTVSGSVGGWADAATVLSILFTLNLILLVFNLIPLPPLDGFGALPLFIGVEQAARAQQFFRQPMVSLIGIIIAWNVFSPLFGPIHIAALNILYPGAGYH